MGENEAWTAAVEEAEEEAQEVVEEEEDLVVEVEEGDVHYRILSLKMPQMLKN